MRRRVLWAAAGLAMLIAVCGVVVIGLVQSGAVAPDLGDFDPFSTSEPGDAAALSWRPDGKHIVFTRDRTGDGDLDLYEIDSDGRNLRRLTNGAGADAPAVSPDGHRIAFVTYRANCSNDLFLARADGSGAAAVGCTEPGEDQPAWSPDGGRLALSRQDYGSDQEWLFVMHADGSHARRLARNESADVVSQHPSWSPDGRSIAYAGLDGIFIISAAGGRPRWLADGMEAAWAPHTDRLAVVVDYETIEILQLRGRRRPRIAKAFRLPELANAPEDLDWAPAERKIAFADGRSLFVLDPNSGTLQKLTNCTHACRMRVRPLAPRRAKRDS